MVKTTKSNTIVANKPVSKISSPIKSPKKEEESYDNENISVIKSPGRKSNKNNTLSSPIRIKAKSPDKKVLSASPKKKGITLENKKEVVRSPNAFPASKTFLTPQVKSVYKIVNASTNSVGGNADGGAAYGENTMVSMQRVVDALIDTGDFDHNSRLIDIGAGLGKPNLHVAQDPGCRLSIGIELLELRWRLSIIVLKNFLNKVSEDPKKDEELHGNTNFLWGDIEKAETLDPFTHIYQFDLAFPPDLQSQIAKKFNESIHSKYLISFRPEYRVVDEYGYNVKLITSVKTSMHGSKENHTAYIYKRLDDKAIFSLKKKNDNLPEGYTRLTLPARPGFKNKGEKSIDVACARYFLPVIKAVLKPLDKFEKETNNLIEEYHNSDRPKRDRKQAVKPNM